MTTQFIVNEKGEKTAVIIPLAEYEELLHQHHVDLELTDEYKNMMDNMIQQEIDGHIHHVTLEHIKSRFISK